MVDMKLKKRFDWKSFFSGRNLSLIYCSIFAILVLFTVIFGTRRYIGDLKEGDIALRSKYAPYDFRYPSGIDQKKTDELKKNVEEKVPVVFSVNPSIEEASVNKVSNIFSVLIKMQQTPNWKDPTFIKGAASDINSTTGLSFSDALVGFFLKRQDLDAVKTGIIDIFSLVYPVGIMSEKKRNEYKRQYDSIKILNNQVDLIREKSFEDVLTVKLAVNLCKKYVLSTFPDDADIRKFSTEIIQAVIESNLVYNEPETIRVKDIAIKNAPVIYNMVNVKKDELILSRGQRVSEKNISQLVQLGVMGGQLRKAPYLWGMFFLIFILIMSGVIYFDMTDKNLGQRSKDVAIILINSLIIIIIGQVIINSPYSSYLIPLAGVSMLITLVINTNAAVFSTLFLSIYIGFLAGGKEEVFFALLIAGLVGIFFVRGARRRSHIMRAGVFSALAAALAIVAVGLLNNLDPKVYLQDSLWGMLGGIVSIFFVMGALPVFEYGFKCTTDITLLELSDLNHPVLKELTLNAPGTYQHSIMVGNLAEAACDAIGANSLLARVGSYYHDIGKIGKAEYFAENEMGSKSKHDKLTSSMSALIIVNHVKDGVELANKHKFNPKIIDFIKEHHGTSLIYYFFHKAVEKAGKDADVKEEDFRYDGPKPQTKEIAIVLLADSVEAAARSLSDPTPARIKGVVQKIINNKFIDHQLDECTLTLKDLDKISASFVRVLNAVFHTRLEYPEAKKSKDIPEDNS